MPRQVQPIHYDPQTVKQLTKEIAVASCVGAAQGALISITSALLLRRFSKVYRNVRTPVRVFYHCSWISMGAVFQADKQLLKFQSKYYDTELKCRERILDEAADRGIFLEEEAASASTTKSG
ncbi:uncharacterized protein ZBAI_00834 [Zygosaccharomyces bailii ISA1307]|uniref:BN860_02784g1_1 n=1 Tax=Zygosaccharomyces bailii (strain CLIB 213 / ATCC 58445 / CBS 680 / BCRC 21525 / NBRC 1098 / NCYC 1416 / NRRL Y-2227) TaxID=1333698 RepID=A0A8J2T246_ZYGB2|nr:BN860_02784g1_1 [Zygosaccharomyces bailii CLIB 213]CDH09050.1 uncharacterized protein ZBAI_00834 [Zygosaccharomyces bailii ISA1307]